MTPEDLKEVFYNNKGEVIKIKPRVENEKLVIQLYGYEIVFHDFTTFGSGSWFINDTSG